MLKIVLVGDQTVGKTSIIRQFIHNSFDPDSRPTIGANFFQKLLFIQNSEINLQFWDTTGQERMRNSFDIYLKGASGAIIVDDYKNLKDTSKIKEWKNLVQDKTYLTDGRPIPIVLFYNKSDLYEDQQDDENETLKKIQYELRLNAVFKVSAKTRNILQNFITYLNIYYYFNDW